MTETQPTETQPKSDSLSTNEWLDVADNRDQLWTTVVELGSVNKAAAQLKLHRPTIYLRAQKDKDFEAELLAAEATNLRQLVDECIEIADDASQDYHEVERRGQPVTEFNPEAVQRAKLRIETRIRLAGKLIPHLYGDQPAKTEFNLHNTVQAVVISDDQRQRLIDLRQKLSDRSPLPLLRDSTGPASVPASTTGQPLPVTHVTTAEVIAQ